MKLNTIDSIIDDILLEMRRNNITESESYSRNQIEQWIIQYRMFLIKEIVNNKLPLSSNFYQAFIVPIKDSIRVEHPNSDGYISKSSIKIPEYITSDLGEKFISSYDQYGNEIQIMSKKRSSISRFNRHKNDMSKTAYIDRNLIYNVDSKYAIDIVEIGGVFINPCEVPGYNYNNDMYPIDPSMLPRLKQMIFQGELKFNLVPDTENDGREKFQIGTK